MFYETTTHDVHKYAVGTHRPARGRTLDGSPAAARRSLASKRIVKLTISAPGIRSAAMTLKR